MSIRLLVILLGWFVFHGYVIIRLLFWGGLKFRLWMVAAALTPAILTFALKIYYIRHDGRLLSWPMRAMDVWMGWLLLAIVSLLVFEVIVLLTRLNTRHAAGGAILLSLALSGFALILAKTVYVRYETIRADLPQPVRIVHLADLHFGYMTLDHLEDVVAKVNALDADLVIITGDLVDRLEDDLQGKLDRLNAIERPIVFTTGNHELYAGLHDVVSLLSGTRLEPLMSGRFVDIEQFGNLKGIRVYGVQDCPTDSELKAWLAEFDVVGDDRFDILATHRPVAPKLAADHGFEMMLCGHTHAGQILPFGAIVRLVYPYFHGIYHVDGMVMNVTAGAGYWGPPMRFPRACEITCLDLEPMDK